MERRRDRIGRLFLYGLVGASAIAVGVTLPACISENTNSFSGARETSSNTGYTPSREERLRNDFSRQPRVYTSEPPVPGVIDRIYQRLFGLD